MVEQLTLNQLVLGSSPSRGTNFAKENEQVGQADTLPTQETPESIEAIVKWPKKVKHRNQVLARIYRPCTGRDSYRVAWSVNRKFQVLKQVIAVVKSSFATLWPRILELLPSGYNAAAVAELFRHLDLSQLQQPFDLLASLGH